MRVQGTETERRLAISGLVASLETRLIEIRRDIAQQLEDVALETGADLIVIGLRRRSPVGKLILGSAASRILLSVSVPVLAVKAAE